MGKQRRQKKQNKSDKLESGPKFGERGKPGECVWKNGNIGHVPKLDDEQSELLREATLHVLEAVKDSPEAREEVIQWIKIVSLALCNTKNKEEKQTKITDFLKESVLPGKVELRGGMLWVEAPSWPYWDEIDANTEYDWNFQWQHSDFGDAIYFMFVVDILQIKRSLRIAFNLETHLVKLKAFQGREIL